MCLPHLQAAKALWDYSAASVRYIFGDSLGDPVADEIMGELRKAGSDGRTRNQIREFFSRNVGRMRSPVPWGCSGSKELPTANRTPALVVVRRKVVRNLRCGYLSGGEDSEGG
jgi:hypothetical protein